MRRLIQESNLQLKMGKKQRVKVLEVLQVQGKESDDLTGLTFKVQLRPSSEPITMSYDQLKYCYPQALIEFYESRSEFFNKAEQSEELQEVESDLLDYDDHMLVNGSKVLQYVNSLTYCLPLKQNQQNQSAQFEHVKVYEEQTRNFYLNYISKDVSKPSNYQKATKESNKIQLQ